VLGEAKQDLSLTIEGMNFQSPKEVRLIQGSEVMDGTVISTSETRIQCKFTILPNQKPGKWDLIIVNGDGGQDRQDEAFELQVPPAQQAPLAQQATPAPPGVSG